MTNYTMFDIDKVEVNRRGDSICIYAKKGLNHATLFFTKKQLKKLIDYAQATLQDSELVKEGVGK